MKQITKHTISKITSIIMPVVCILYKLKKNLTIFKLKRWYNMLRGKSILHVNQGVGRIYSKELILGYYNDLTEKITKDKNIELLFIPTIEIETGEKVVFPITVFQYGLGAYDLYLTSGSQIYLDKFLLMCDWALDHQQTNGAWVVQFGKSEKSDFSAMSQGEGASLLIRAYITTNKNIYFEAAKKAIEFMLLPKEKKGTTLYVDDYIIFLEFSTKPIILNGWIFAIFGLYDYCKISKDGEMSKTLKTTVETLKIKLPEFDNGYWSMYDTNGAICSPFYHKLHIAQLEALNHIFEEDVFAYYANKWENYQNNRAYKMLALTKKIIQKLLI